MSLESIHIFKIVSTQQYEKCSVVLCEVFERFSFKTSWSWTRVGRLVNTDFHRGTQIKRYVFYNAHLSRCAGTVGGGHTSIQLRPEFCWFSISLAMVKVMVYHFSPPLFYLAFPPHVDSHLILLSQKHEVHVLYFPEAHRGLFSLFFCSSQVRFKKTF